MNQYQVKRDGTVLFTSNAETETQAQNACFAWLLNHQSASIDWAMKYEGYTIEPVTEDQEEKRHMNVLDALKETGIAETYIDGKTATVKDCQGEFDNEYVLTFQLAAMPPYLTVVDTDIAAIVEVVRTSVFRDQDWHPVEPEQ